MHLAIDIGNTRVKAGLFEQVELVQLFEAEDWNQLSLPLHDIEACIISNVGEVINVSEKLGDMEILELSSETPLPIELSYNSPQTLGKDRIALAVAGSNLHPNSNVLVIDLGTCITYDLVNDREQYLGGNISPGVNMRLKAMHTFTGNLPLVKLDPQTGLLGKDTESSMKSGVFHGILHEMDGMISAYKQEYDDLTVVLTGGDESLFESQLKNRIFVTPNLVLIGLNSILTYNVEHKA